MSTPIGTVAAIALVWLACGRTAAGAELTVSTVGLGDAKFGMDIDAAERAIGRTLVQPKRKSKAQQARSAMIDRGDRLSIRSR